MVLLTAGCNFGSSSHNAASSLVLNNSSLDFGNVSVGETKTEKLTLTNSATIADVVITISDISVSGTGFRMRSTSLPLTLAAGESSTISVVFAPKSSGSAAGTLAIQVDGVGDAGVVPLAGDGIDSSELDVSPSTMDFGTVAVGDSKTVTGRLSAGSSDVKVTSASWNGDGFSISGISFPVTVQANQTVSFQVTFSPSTAGTSSGRISFNSDAANSPARVSLTGTGQSSASGHSVSLSWRTATGTVVGYNVYRSTITGGPYSKLNSYPQPTTAYTDGSVAAGQTYYYVVTAVGVGSSESGYSDEVRADIPTP